MVEREENREQRIEKPSRLFSILYSLFFPTPRPAAPGFTLPELLVTMAIIGTISTIGVVSYSSARSAARDVKRASDMKQLQTAIELYYDGHNSYPGDGRSGSEGVILGTAKTKTL